MEDEQWLERLLSVCRTHLDERRVGGLPLPDDYLDALREVAADIEKRLTDLRLGPPS